MAPSQVIASYTPRTPLRLTSDHDRQRLVGEVMGRVEKASKEEEEMQTRWNDPAPARSSSGGGGGTSVSRVPRRGFSSKNVVRDRSDAADTPNLCDGDALSPRRHRAGEEEEEETEGPQPQRSLSTSQRLQTQGFRESARRRNDFAVKSIRRGSEEWHSTLRPFVADLAFMSLVQRRWQSEVSFRPYTCQAAVLFVDLSNYSKITAAIAHRGAHILSGIVNAYLSRLLAIVSDHGGDVIKFAGDAVLVVWYGEEKDLEINLLAAAKCVMEMQDTAGHHPVEGTADLHFSIHCGLTCGLLESEIFAAPNHVHMQRLYHSVGGESLVEISELVEIAKAGQVCVSDRVASHLGPRGLYQCADGEGDTDDEDDDYNSSSRSNSGYKILTGLVLDDALVDAIEVHVVDSVYERAARRQTKIEEEFIHPSVIRLLSHGGLSPTQISQMRNLCVLFIAMTSNGSSVNWLMEVQTILDKHRCPSTWRHGSNKDAAASFVPDFF